MPLAPVRTPTQNTPIRPTNARVLSPATHTGSPIAKSVLLPQGEASFVSAARQATAMDVAISAVVMSRCRRGTAVRGPPQMDSRRERGAGDVACRRRPARLRARALVRADGPAPPFAIGL